MATPNELTSTTIPGVTPLNNGSLAGTMTGVPAPSIYTPPKNPDVVQPAVVTSTQARKQTTSNIQQLEAIKVSVAKAQQMANELKAQEDAAKAEADKTSLADKAIKDAVGTQTVPQETPEQFELKRQMLDMAGQMAALIPQMDADAGAMISQIEDEYDALARQQEKLNSSYEKGIITEGFVSGRARYAPLIQAGIIKVAIDQGMQKIADLQVKKSRLILEAKIAQREGKFKALNDTMQAYRTIVKDEQELAQKTYENYINASKEARAIKKEQIDQTSVIAEGVAENYSMMIANDGQEAADAYLGKVADNLDLPVAYLSSNVQKTLASRKQTEKTAVLSLAKDYPDVNILASDSIDEAAKKVRSSTIYKNDILKSELDISNTRSLIGDRQSNSNIDYADGVFQLYSNATGQLVSSPTTARAIQGYASSLLGGKEVIPDDQEVKDPKTQIKNSDAEKLLSDAFKQFQAAKGKSSAVWNWLSSPDSFNLSDEDKAQYIKEKFGLNPDDFLNTIY